MCEVDLTPMYELRRRYESPIDIDIDMSKEKDLTLTHTYARNALTL